MELGRQHGRVTPGCVADRSVIVRTSVGEIGHGAPGLSARHPLHRSTGRHSASRAALRCHHRAEALDSIPPPDTTFGWRPGARLLRTVSATQTRHEESPLRYEIHVEGQIGASRSEWFDGMHITSGPDGTTIAGEVADQSALHGLLDRVRDFGLTVVSVTRVDRHPKEQS